nr:TPA_asm: hypothetical protein HUJ06_011206 [Nelumbo nucifera]
MAYVVAAKRIRGDKAKLNFVEQTPLVPTPPPPISLNKHH